MRIMFNTECFEKFVLPLLTLFKQESEDWTIPSGPINATKFGKIISERGTWFSRGVCTGLRGEKLLLIDLYGMAKNATQLLMKQSDPDLHFKFVILGRTKGVQEDGHKFAIRCVKVTQ